MRAVETGTPSVGVKGPSALSLLPGFDIIEGVSLTTYTVSSLELQDLLLRYGVTLKTTNLLGTWAGPYHKLTNYC